MRKILHVLTTVGIVLLSLTWCIIQTLIGAIFFLVLLFGGRVTHYRGMVVTYHRIGISFSLGVFAFISNKAPGANKALGHLYGHFLQSCILGPFYLFTVVLSQLVVRIPFIMRRRLERGKTVDDTLAERTAAKLASSFGE